MACMHAALPRGCSSIASHVRALLVQQRRAENGDNSCRAWGACSALPSLGRMQVILPAMQKQSPDGPWPSLLQGCTPRKVCGALGKAKELRARHFLGGVGESDPSAEHPALSCGELSVICHGHGKAAVADVIPCIVWPCLDTVPAACYLQWCRHKLAENGRRCS